MTDLSAEERGSVVEEGSILVLSLLRREEDSGNGQSLSERFHCLSERALQKGLDAVSRVHTNG